MPEDAAARTLSLLFVDDEPSNVDLFRLQFEDDFVVHTASSGGRALEILEREDIALLLTDERMPGMSGIELLARVVERWPDVVRTIVSAYGDAERLLAAINRGHAHEYVLKPWERAEMRGCIERGLAVAERRRRLAARAEVADKLAGDLRRQHDPEHIVGASGGLAAAVAAARKAARTDATVLIQGETGTGKELFARLVHEQSARAGGAFVQVNCAALAEGVLESELFGHEQGAFTGALKMRRGRFELASGGTIFLDEIGDVSPKLQVSLLRVLQERVIERVGGGAPIPIDVRVVAATHQDLPALTRAGRFREDLYYRLAVVPLAVPPLRERPQDLEPLIQHFIAKYSQHRLRARVSREAMASLSRYLWPGNVRELENLVQRALVMASLDLSDDELVLELDDFCLTLDPGPARGLREQAREIEAEQLRELLLAHGGNCARAARALGIARTTFLSRAKKHGLL